MIDYLRDFIAVQRTAIDVVTFDASLDAVMCLASNRRILGARDVVLELA